MRIALKFGANFRLMKSARHSAAKASATCHRLIQKVAHGTLRLSNGATRHVQEVEGGGGAVWAWVTFQLRFQLPTMRAGRAEEAHTQLGV